MTYRLRRTCPCLRPCRSEFWGFVRRGTQQGKAPHMCAHTRIKNHVSRKASTRPLQVMATTHSIFLDVAILSETGHGFTHLHQARCSQFQKHKNTSWKRIGRIDQIYWTQGGRSESSGELIPRHRGKPSDAGE